MSLNLNIHKSTYTKEDFENALLIVKDTNYNINSYKTELKDIIEWIVKFSREFNVNLNDDLLKERILHWLISEWSFEYFWLAKKIEEILYPNYKRQNSENKNIWIERILNSNNLDEKRKFVPYYQWIRNNKTGEIKKYEALVRYNDWENIISPWEFIEIAEKNNLLWIISRKMIQNVIEEMTLHDYEISINLDGELADINIINLILEILKKHNISHKRLTIEILETIKIETEYEKILSNINTLKEAWVKISIDDYGSWFSTLERVLETEPNYIKIDWWLIQKLNRYILTNNEKGKQNIKLAIKSIVDLAHWMWAEVIAEHIENHETQTFLEELGVDFSQWFYYSIPSRDIIRN